MKSALQILNRWVLPSVTGVFYALALPPHNHSEAGWFALVPLLFALEGCRPGEAFRRGFLAGLVFFGMTTWWIIHVSLPGMVALVAFLALYLGVAGVFLAAITGNSVRHRSPDRAVAGDPRTTGNEDSVWRNVFAAVVGAAGWVTLEWLRGHFPLGGFGWNGLGVTQYRFTPVIQFSRYTGMYGVSALLFVMNYSLFCTMRRYVRHMCSGTSVRRLSWEFYAAMILFFVVAVDGMRETSTAQLQGATQSLRLALVQGNIPQSLKFDEREKPMILDRYRSLTTTATLEQADLIIWPETATPDALQYDPEIYAVVTNVTAQTQAYLLTGTIDFTPRSDPVEAFNAVALVRPNGMVAGIYRKMHLVPFGEYVPLRKIVPVLKWFTPITDSFECGRDTTLFNLHGLNFGAVICFEDTLPDLYRRFVKRGADFMVNLTNDAWFKDSPAAEMHLANAIFRAVENRRSLVRCTNNGVTCLIDQSGIVRHRVEPFAPATVAFTLPVPMELPVTFYTQYGDVFAGGCAVISLAGLLSVTSFFRWRPTSV